MYEVVGCRDCGELWIREGDAETAGCPRCGRRFKVDRLRTLGTAESADLARDIRSELLAERTEYGGIVAGYTDSEADGRAIDDEQYLTSFGITPETLEEVNETDHQPNLSHRELVLRCIDEVETPSPDQVIAAATEYGLPADGAEELLERLQTAGDVTFDGETYRRL